MLPITSLERTIAETSSLQDKRETLLAKFASAADRVLPKIDWDPMIEEWARKVEEARGEEERITREFLFAVEEKLQGHSDAHDKFNKGHKVEKKVFESIKFASKLFRKLASLSTGLETILNSILAGSSATLGWVQLGVRYSECSLRSKKITEIRDELETLQKELEISFDQKKHNRLEGLTALLVAIEDDHKQAVLSVVRTTLIKVLGMGAVGVSVTRWILAWKLEEGNPLLNEVTIASNSLGMGLSVVAYALSVKGAINKSDLLGRTRATIDLIDSHLKVEDNPYVHVLLSTKRDYLLRTETETLKDLVSKVLQGVVASIAAVRTLVGALIAGGVITAAATPGLNVALGVLGGVMIAISVGRAVRREWPNVEYFLHTFDVRPRRYLRRLAIKEQKRIQSLAQEGIVKLKGDIERFQLLIPAAYDVLDVIAAESGEKQAQRVQMAGEQCERLHRQLAVKVDRLVRCTEVSDSAQSKIHALIAEIGELEQRKQKWALVKGSKKEAHRFYNYDLKTLMAVHSILEAATQDEEALEKLPVLMGEFQHVPLQNDQPLSYAELYRFVVAEPLSW